MNLSRATPTPSACWRLFLLWAEMYLRFEDTIGTADLTENQVGQLLATEDFVEICHDDETKIQK